jgi:pyruvate dehydrogenase (quinone)
MVGQQARMALGSNYQQEVDLVTLFKDVASEYVQVCMAPKQAAHLIDRAMRIAKATQSTRSSSTVEAGLVHESPAWRSRAGCGTCALGRRPE